MSLPVDMRVNKVCLLDNPQTVPKLMRPLHFIGVSALFIERKPPQRGKDQ